MSIIVHFKITVGVVASSVKEIAVGVLSQIVPPINPGKERLKVVLHRSRVISSYYSILMKWYTNLLNPSVNAIFPAINPI